ncbi:hypothetical protein, conserved [Plasmodium gonderi]|uniref:Uncharacterized protein n=1 Tax=Plasmodium gonderi TaxID=77519 RepID=A0A1Y1JKX3_PLAGO|nr:hypothetical protein, conserved [Plasmodium gonderi]GAW80694.1 hypothetical protein, conserved [Plasmodium gonderi]
MKKKNDLIIYKDEVQDETLNLQIEKEGELKQQVNQLGTKLNEMNNQIVNELGENSQKFQRGHVDKKSNNTSSIDREENEKFCKNGEGNEKDKCDAVKDGKENRHLSLEPDAEVEAELEAAEEAEAVITSQQADSTSCENYSSSPAPQGEEKNNTDESHRSRETRNELNELNELNEELFPLSNSFLIRECKTKSEFENENENSESGVKQRRVQLSDHQTDTKVNQSANHEKLKDQDGREKCIRKENEIQGDVKYEGQEQTCANASDVEKTKEVNFTNHMFSNNSFTDDDFFNDTSFDGGPFDKDDFHNFSHIEKAQEDPNEVKQNSLIDIYKEIKICEHLFLDNFGQTCENIEIKEIINNEKKEETNNPSIDFNSIEDISHFLCEKHIPDSDHPSIQQCISENMKLLIQEQKKNNKKIKMNKNYIDFKTFQNTLPPNLRQKIFKEYKKNI